jgi:imidazolonepropionase-like amidohydrolase
VRHAVDTLQAGFTTLRDLGTEGADYADVGIKRAIDEGKIPGPRLLVATRAIVATASYGPAERSYRPDMELPYGAQQATGVDEVTKAVREQARTAPTGSSSMPTTAPASTAAPARPSRSRK